MMLTAFFDMDCFLRTALRLLRLSTVSFLRSGWSLWLPGRVIMLSIPGKIIVSSEQAEKFAEPTLGRSKRKDDYSCGLVLTDFLKAAALLFE